MNLSLTLELESFVQLKVRSGLYGSASEIICEALRLMDQRDQLQELKKREFRGKIVARMPSLQAGEG